MPLDPDLFGPGFWEGGILGCCRECLSSGVGGRRCTTCQSARAGHPLPMTGPAKSAERNLQSSAPSKARPRASRLLAGSRGGALA
ncbi:MAG: hypothetical protein JWO26_3428, partial [Rhodospirillales bacterium]|nr:hypothetical protein [Rhodospirillales bacterium]